MIDIFKGLARILRSLPLAILLGAAVSGIVVPFLQWLGLLIFRYMPSPPGSVWVDFMLIHAAGGAIVGAAAYAASRLPPGWLRTCLYASLYFLLVEGEINDFVDRSLDDYLSVGTGASLFSGVIIGTMFYALELRNRRRVAAAREAGDASGSGAGDA